MIHFIVFFYYMKIFLFSFIQFLTQKQNFDKNSFIFLLFYKIFRFLNNVFHFNLNFLLFLIFYLDFFLFI